MAEAARCAPTRCSPAFNRAATTLAMVTPSAGRGSSWRRRWPPADICRRCESRPAKRSLWTLRLKQAWDDIDRELTIERFFLKFIYVKQEPWYGDPSQDDRRSHAPDGKRPHPPRRGETEGITLQRQGFVRYSRHEGLAPVRLSIGLETGSGSFPSGRILAGRRIDRPAFSPVLGLLALGRRVPFSRHEAPRPPGSDGTAPERPAR